MSGPFRTNYNINDYYPVSDNRVLPPSNQPNQPIQPNQPNQPDQAAQPYPASQPYQPSQLYPASQSYPASQPYQTSQSHPSPQPHFLHRVNRADQAPLLERRPFVNPGPYGSSDRCGDVPNNRDDVYAVRLLVTEEGYVSESDYIKCDHPIFNQVPLPFPNKVGVPIIMMKMSNRGTTYLQDEKYLAMNPETGLIPPDWERPGGDILIARKDKMSFFPKDALTMADYCKINSELMKKGKPTNESPSQYERHHKLAHWSGY